MACVGGGGSTCSQSPFRQAVRFEHALTSKTKTCGSNLPFAITESEGDSMACAINDFHIQGSKFALRISILDLSAVSSLHLMSRNRPMCELQWLIRKKGR